MATQYRVRIVDDVQPWAKSLIFMRFTVYNHTTVASARITRINELDMVQAQLLVEAILGCLRHGRDYIPEYAYSVEA